jgi:hypothetical protein
MNESGPGRWVYVLINLAVAVGTAALVYFFEWRING